MSGGPAFWGHRNIAFPTIFLKAPSRQQIPEPPPFLLPAAELSFPMEVISSAQAPPMLASRKTN